MTGRGDTRAPERAAEALDASITALLRRTLEHAEAVARDARAALGENTGTAQDGACPACGHRPGFLAQTQPNPRGGTIGARP
jgi:hypothetical protein